jgi:hypothetical protein
MSKKSTGRPHRCQRCGKALAADRLQATTVTQGFVRTQYHCKCGGITCAVEEVVWVKPDADE